MLAALVIAAFTRYWASLAPAGGALLAGWIAISLLLAFQTASWIGRWALLWRMERPAPVKPEPGLRVAAVTTFVPDVEPLEMVERTLRAMVAMAYPHDTWVLDEANDSQLKAFCERIGVRHFSRRGSSELERPAGRLAAGAKYGNYNAWLAAVGSSEYDVLAMFDPDHVPESGYLDALLGHFADATVAFVQSPQVYYNEAASFVARGAAEESYAYYSTHLAASFAMGQAILIGSHNLQRISALEKVGGVAAHDADDLLISLRYRAEGLRGVYVPEILALGLTPADWRGYLQQQLRWTQSVLDLKLRQIPELRAQLTPVAWAMSQLHGAFYLRALAIPIAYGVVAMLLTVGAAPAYLAPPALAAMCALGLAVSHIDRFRIRFALDARREGGLHWRAGVLQCAKWPTQVVALARAIRGIRATYVVTPKRAERGAVGVLWIHAVVGSVMSAFAWIGSQRGAAPTLQAIAAGIAVLSFGLALSSFARSRAPFDAALHEARRQALFGH